MKKIFLFLSVFITIIAVAQHTKQKVKFISTNSLGSMWGANQNLICFQTVNGISYKQWNYGIGVSFDGYGSQSTPIFAEVKRTIGRKLFVYTDAGVNIPWRTTNFPKKYSWSGQDAYTLKNTFYGELGLGIQSAINSSTSIFASIGYSYKTFAYTQHNMYSWLSPDGYIDNDFFYKYNRIALRLGFQF